MSNPAIPRAIAAVGAVFFIGFGLWAFADPEGFFDSVATFEPYNEHLIHDVGAFQIGLGAVLALAAARLPGMVTALGGVGIGAVFHAISHYMDADHGGQDSDPAVMTVVAIVLLAGAALAWRSTGAGAGDGRR